MHTEQKGENRGGISDGKTGWKWALRRRSATHGGGAACARPACTRHTRVRRRQAPRARVRPAANSVWLGFPGLRAFGYGSAGAAGLAASPSAMARSGTATACAARRGAAADRRALPQAKLQLRPAATCVRASRATSVPLSARAGSVVYTERPHAARGVAAPAERPAATLRENTKQRRQHADTKAHARCTRIAVAPRSQLLPARTCVADMDIVAAILRSARGCAPRRSFLCRSAGPLCPSRQSLSRRSQRVRCPPFLPASRAASARAAAPAPRCCRCARPAAAAPPRGRSRHARSDCPHAVVLFSRAQGPASPLSPPLHSSWAASSPAASRGCRRRTYSQRR
jgi:hypothetical protein